MIAFLVGVQEAKPNKMFTEEQRKTIRFLNYSVAVPCAECGRRSKTHWTQLHSFHAHTFGDSPILGIAESGKVHLPFAPVCRDHLLSPASIPKQTRKKTPKGKTNENDKD